jgi:hypothetical protein
MIRIIAFLEDKINRTKETKNQKLNIIHVLLLLGKKLFFAKLKDFFTTY